MWRRERQHRTLAAATALVCVVGCATAGFGQTYAEAVLADRPLAYFRFEETAGESAKDSSGSDFQARYCGGIVLGAQSAHPSLGHAAEFGKDKSHVRVLRNAAFKFGTEDLSIEFWFNCQEQVETRGDIMIYKGEGKDFALFKPCGNANIFSFAVPGRIFQAQTDPVPFGQWHHAVFVRQKNVDLWYINGQPSGTSTGNQMPIDMEADILIGANHTGDSSRIDKIDDITVWNGLIDEFAFYRYALTEEQVRRHVRAAAESAPSSNSATGP